MLVRSITDADGVSCLWSPSQSLFRCHPAVFAVVLFQCRERGTGDPGDDGALDVVLGEGADQGHRRPYKFVSVPLDELPLDVLWAETRPS